jgi:hypothetical protein
VVANPYAPFPQTVEDKGEQLAGDRHGGDVAAAVLLDPGPGLDEPAGVSGQFLHRLDGGPAEQGGTLFGDRPAMHDGV